MSDLICWKCGESLKGIQLPYSRRDVCLHCGAELHVCMICRFYDTSLTAQCQKDDADPPLYKDRANFCDYLKPRANAYQKPSNRLTAESRDRLAELFGDNKPVRSAENNTDDPFAENKAARKKLQDLFDVGNDEN